MHRVELIPKFYNLRNREYYQKYGETKIIGVISPPRVRSIFLSSYHTKHFQSNCHVRLAFPATLICFRQNSDSQISAYMMPGDGSEIENLLPIPLPSIGREGLVCMGNMRFDETNFAEKFWLSTSDEDLFNYNPPLEAWWHKTKSEPLKDVAQWVYDYVLVRLPVCQINLIEKFD